MPALKRRMIHENEITVLDDWLCQVDVGYGQVSYPVSFHRPLYAACFSNTLLIPAIHSKSLPMTSSVIAAWCVFFMAIGFAAKPCFFASTLTSSALSYVMMKSPLIFFTSRKKSLMVHFKVRIQTTPCSLTTGGIRRINKKHDPFIIFMFFPRCEMRLHARNTIYLASGELLAGVWQEWQDTSEKECLCPILHASEIRLLRLKFHRETSGFL